MEKKDRRRRWLDLLGETMGEGGGRKCRDGVVCRELWCCRSLESKLRPHVCETGLKGQTAEVTYSTTTAGRSSFSGHFRRSTPPLSRRSTSQGRRMSTPARKRLMRDFKRLQQDPPAGISGAPIDNNIMLWNAVIFGPDDTPWDGGTFKLTLQFSEDYPNKPPTVRFISRMFHPNIYADGSICLDILQNQWSPIYDVAAILTSIQSLLCDPNPNSPANSEAARLFSENKREYNRKVREIVEQSWTAD
ncbi:hypothetical protein L6452_41569 [Arctium lappa]|uniref:Uncharacterized protein n=1 Tax=Arctium lappa TaxID=4217 RepID=A0ACB8XQX2_ARCLA|nr:hypothetical protein L6452_41569 [Arctium lappa]